MIGPQRPGNRPPDMTKSASTAGPTHGSSSAVSVPPSNESQQSATSSAVIQAVQGPKVGATSGASVDTSISSLATTRSPLRLSPSQLIT